MVRRCCPKLTGGENKGGSRGGCLPPAITGGRTTEISRWIELIQRATTAPIFEYSRSGAGN